MRPLTPEEVARREALRAGNLTGSWRARGTNRQVPGLANALMLLERDGKVQGTDTDRRGFLKGEVHNLPDGRRVVRGTYRREDGRRGGFAWSVTGKGNRIAGLWKDANGTQGAWEAVKAGDGLGKDQVEFLRKRYWRPQAAARPQTGLMGVAGLGPLSGGIEGLTYSQLKIGGAKVKVPTGYAAKGPGGSAIKVSRRGVEAKPPDVEKLIEQASGGAAAPPSEPGGDERATAGRSSATMKVALAGAGLAVVVAGVAFVLTRRRRAQA